MLIDLQKKLFEDFPLLYGDKDKSMRYTAMCWGIDTGPGWYELIYNLSAKLEKLIEKYIDENPDLPCTWCGVKESKHKNCHNPEDGKHEPSYPKASQVKEKYGELRFYMTSATDEMYELIDEAEEKSRYICETCGAPGSTRGTGWLTTLCDDCDKSK